jgi:predicted ATPase with chaperone activity
LVDEILWQLKDDKLLEVLGQVGPLNYQFRITNSGLDLASRLMDLCGYVGPAPVSLQEYTAAVKAQKQLRQATSLEKVREATASLILPEELLEVAALAVSSSRSLFIFGPPGNGKSSLGRSLHNAVSLSIWIPHAIAVDNQVIRLYDPEYHEPADEPPEGPPEHDERWIHVRQPFVMSGGELTMEQLDLVYDPSVNFYEAPPHLKANCGTYFIDDLGRQRIDPFDLLNRWIVPLEQGIDFLSLANGKKIDVPFQMMLIVATNLSTDDVADPAFLRRMGYRIFLDNPSEADYRRIFERQADNHEFQLAPGLLDHVVGKYRTQHRSWRASEPRDLLIRCDDVIELRGCDPLVDSEILDIAWQGYFSNEPVE